MSDTNTARERAALFRELCNPTEWLSGEHGATERDANLLIDRFADAVRDQVLAEAAELLTSTSGARLDAIDEDDRSPSDWEQHQEWCDAADLLLAARTTTALTTQEQL